MERYSWWELVNVAVWDLSRGYVEEQLFGTWECVGMLCIERLWKGTVAGTGECGGMDYIERIL